MGTDQSEQLSDQPTRLDASSSTSHPTYTTTQHSTPSYVPNRNFCPCLSKDTHKNFHVETVCSWEKETRNNQNFH